MPDAKQSAYTVMTLSEWMSKHGYDLDDVVIALDEIFGLPKPEATAIYLEEEIEHQARLLLFLERDEIQAIAGWRWTLHADHLEVYFGVRLENTDPDLRYEVIGAITARLEAERIRSNHAQVRYALLQYSPIDRQMSQACLDLGCQPCKEINTFFKDHLGTRWSLRSMRLPFTD